MTANQKLEILPNQSEKKNIVIIIIGFVQLHNLPIAQWSLVLINKE